jgi:hypothetical protein
VTADEPLTHVHIVREMAAVRGASASAPLSLHALYGFEQRSQRFIVVNVHALIHVFEHFFHHWDDLTNCECLHGLS